jgi:aryl-alcohol dehydrogenase-like predicted oxidoreductase
MEQRTLGSSGPQLSVIGLGCNNFGMRVDEAGTAAVVHAALDAGITHFDTAEMYGGGKSEEFLGAALGSRRDEVVIATKFLPRPKGEPYTPGKLAARINEAVEGSLRRLGTDRIDLYYQHYPDLEAPVEEALVALTALVQAGKVVHLASSNVSAEQIHEAVKTSESQSLASFTGTQIHWSLLARDVEASVVPAATDVGLGVVPFFPLASGMLTGKYRRDEPFPENSRMIAFGEQFAQRFATDENFAKVDAYSAFAEQHGHSVTELATGWLLSQPSVTSVITGATKPEQVTLNVRPWILTAAEAAEVANL